MSAALPSDVLGVELDRQVVALMARRLLRARRRSRGSNLPLVEWLESASPELQWRARHLSLLIAKLEAVTRGEIKRLLVSMPPRHGKSQLITVRYPVSRLERDPAVRVCVGCYNENKAADFGRKARIIARRRLPSLDVERQNVLDWQTLEGGVYRSVGVGNPPTGEGFDLLIIDDPIKKQAEANSRAARDRVWSWYETDMLSRLEPGGALIVVMTRWQEDDLAGRILAGEDAANWTVVNLPAIAEDGGDILGRSMGEALWPERWPIEELEARWRGMLPSTRAALYQGQPKAPEGHTLPVQRIVRTIGWDEAPLWRVGDPLLRCDKCGARSYRSRQRDREWIDLVEARRRSGLDPLGEFDHQRDVRAENIRRAEKMADEDANGIPHECGGRWQEAERFRRCRAWDFATGAKHNADYSVGVLLEGPDRDGFFYWLDTVRGKWEPAERNKIMRETAERDGVATAIRIPRDFRGNVGKEIVSGLKVALSGFKVVAVEPKGEKTRRAEALATTMGDGRIVLVNDSEWPRFFDRGEAALGLRAAHEVAIDELRGFGAGSKNDDIADALVDAHNECAQPKRLVVY